MLSLLEKLPDGLIGKGWIHDSLSGNPSLPLQFVDNNPDLPWNWYDVIHHPDIDHHFILKHIDRFLRHRVDVYYILSYCPDISNDIIRQLADKLDDVVLSRSANPQFLNLEKSCWYNLSCNPQLNLQFIELHKQELFWNFVSSHSIFVKYYEDRYLIIDKFIDYIDWHILSNMIELDEDTLIRYITRWKPERLVLNSTITKTLFKTYITKNGIDYFIPHSYHLLDIELFIRIFPRELAINDIDRISQFVTITDDIIHYIGDLLNWSLVSINESLTDELIEKYASKIHHDMLVYNPSMSVKTMKLFADRMGNFNLSSHPNLTMEVVEYIEQLEKPDVIMTNNYNPDDESCLNYWRWSEISKNLYFSESQVHKYRHEVDWYNLSRNPLIEASTIIMNSWLPWDNKGLSVRQYPSNNQWMDDSMDTDKELREIRPIIYQWELKNDKGRYNVDKLTNPEYILILAKEEYPIQCSHKLLQQLIRDGRDSDAIVLSPCTVVSKIIRVRRDSSEQLLLNLERYEIPYSFRLSGKYISIGSMRNVEDGISFTNSSNGSDMLRNYLDWRGLGYKMKIVGSSRPSYIDNPKAEIMDQSKVRTKLITSTLRDLEKNPSEKLFTVMVGLDLNLEYCTKTEYSRYWKIVDLARITNHKALLHAKSIGVNIDIFSEVLSRSEGNSAYITSKIMSSCSRLAWYCEQVDKNDVIKLISLVSFNQELNYYIFNIILILALRGKIDLSEYAHYHPDIYHLVSIKHDSEK